MKLLLKNGTPIIIVLLLISISLYYSRHISSVPSSSLMVLSYILLGLLLLLLGFGYGFNRLKVFYLGIHVLLLFVIQNWNLFESMQSFKGELMPILLAVNITVLLLVKDGAVLSIQGKIVALYLLIESIMIYFFNEKIEMLLTQVTVPISFSYINISGTALLLFFLILLSLLISIVKKYTSYKVFLFGSIIALMLGFPLEGDVNNSQLFFIVSSIFLLLAVVYRTYAMAYIDELTKIPSRRMLKVDLAKLGSKYTLAMLDIDFFKKFNDRYGHDVGDDVLILVAKGLETVTGGGKAYRYGGEEFTIVFPRKNVEDVIPHLEDLRERISQKEYLHKKRNRNGDMTTQKLRVTISIGVAEKQSKSKSPADVMKEADKALYRAKKKGRNCVSK